MFCIRAVSVVFFYDIEKICTVLWLQMVWEMSGGWLLFNLFDLHVIICIKATQHRYGKVYRDREKGILYPNYIVADGYFEF